MSLLFKTPQGGKQSYQKYNLDVSYNLASSSTKAF